MKLKDHSIKYETLGIEFSIFRSSQDEMPQAARSGDVVLIRNARVSFSLS